MINTGNFGASYYAYTIAGNGNTAGGMTGTFSADRDMSVYIIAVGGGGGGASSAWWSSPGNYTYSGGGGSGGLQTNVPGFGSSRKNQIIGATSISARQVNTFTIGAGGAGGFGPGNGTNTNATGDVGVTGENTTITISPGQPSQCNITAYGGGGGGPRTFDGNGSYATVALPGLAGGCGGGAPSYVGSAYAGTGSQGFDGGYYIDLSDTGFGGGGQSDSAINSADGGAGYTVGTLSFGGGGGAASYNKTTISINGGGTGGRGDGGSGIPGNLYIQPTAGQNGTGGGGGAGGPAQAGGRGGDGFIVILIPISNANNTIYAAANIYPRLTNVYDIGSADNRFFNVYASNVYAGVKSVFLDGPGFTMHLTGTNRMLNIVDICDASTSAIPGTMQSQTCIVAVGNPEPGYSAIQFSTDGTSWNNLSGGAVPQSFTAGSDVAFDGNNNWVAVGQSGIVTSSTGNVWSTVTPETIQNVSPAAVCYSSFNKAWYTVGFDTCGRNTIKKCPSTGIQQTAQGGWTNAISASSPSFFGSNAALVGIGGHGGATIATNGGNMILAGGYASDNGSNSSILYAYTSNDTNWSNAKSYETGSNLRGACPCLAYNGEYWLAATGIILLSRDGKIWKEAAAFTDNAVIAVEWTGQYWIASTLGQYVWRSYDGYTWTFMNPGFAGFTYCIGWNGLRLMVGGYSLGPTVSTIMSLKPTNTSWQPAVDASDATITQIFGQVNNFANRTLLPNAPLIPASAVINCNVVPPPTTLGKLGDYYNVPSAIGLPSAYYGPKFEDTTYGSNGSVSFLLTSTISQAGVVTTNPSTGYIINTSDFAINWWMYSLEAASPIAVAPPKGSIIGFYDAGLTAGSFEVSISGDKGLYLNIDGNIASLNTSVSAKTWQYCTLTRNSSQSNGMVWSRGLSNLTLDIQSGGSPAVATSANGQYITMLTSNSRIQTSSNYGNTWSIINPSNPYMSNAAMSSDGRYQTVVAKIANSFFPNPIFNSSNYGVSWTNILLVDPSIGFKSVAMSSDGARRVGLAFPRGFIYTSSNYGSNWTRITGSSNAGWASVAMSSTGQYITALPSNSSNVYVSSNYGSTISQVSVLNRSLNFISSAMSSTGQYQTITVNENVDAIYISSNYGLNWSKAQYSIDDYSNVVMNATGQYQLTHSSNGSNKIYTSSNYGGNWVQTNAPTGQAWADIAISSTGEYMYAFTYAGGVSNFWTSGVNQGIKFYTGPVGGVSQLTYSSLQTNESLGNAVGRFSIGYNPASLLCNVLLTNVRVSTGFSDPLANFIPTSPLTSISGTKLLFTAPNSASGLVWADSSVYNTSMTPTTFLASWTGFNPLQTITLSWGAQDPRTPFTFTGRGYPPGATVLATSLSGDTYMDVSGRYMYTYTLSANGVFGYY